MGQCFHCAVAGHSWMRRSDLFLAYHLCIGGGAHIHRVWHPLGHKGASSVPYAVWKHEGGHDPVICECAVEAAGGVMAGRMMMGCRSSRGWQWQC
jgi:hypothetical protein